MSDPQVSKRVHVGWRRARQRVRPVKAHDFAAAWRARWRRRWRHSKRNSKRGSLGLQLQVARSGTPCARPATVCGAGTYRGVSLSDPQVSKRVHVGWRRARQRVRPVKAHDFAAACPLGERDGGEDGGTASVARLAFSCVPWSVGSSSESAPLVEGSAESGEQPVLTRLATSGVHAEGGAHPHSAATTLLAWCLDESASKTAVLPRVRERNGCACATRRTWPRVSRPSWPGHARPSLVRSPPRPAPRRSGTSPLRRVNTHELPMPSNQESNKEASKQKTQLIDSPFTLRAPRHVEMCIKRVPLRRGTVCARAPSLAVLNVRRCDRCTRTALAHGIHWHPSSPLRCFPLCCPALALREQTCVSLCLSHDCDFSACLSAVARRRPQYASVPSIPARFTAT